MTSDSRRRRSVRTPNKVQVQADLTESDDEALPLQNSTKHNKRKRIPVESDSEESVPALEEEEYEIEYIVDSRHKHYKGKTVLEYFIHWKNYGIDDRSWTLADQLDDDDPPVVEFYKKNPKKPHKHQRSAFDLLKPQGNAPRRGRKSDATPQQKPIRGVERDSTKSKLKKHASNGTTHTGTSFDDAVSIQSASDDDDAEFVVPSDDDGDVSVKSDSEEDSPSEASDPESEPEKKKKSKGAKGAKVEPTKPKAKKFNGGWGNRVQGKKKAAVSLGSFRTPVVKKYQGNAKDMSVDLPPMNDIEEMFYDLTAKMPSVVKLTERLNGRKLRVATMCSGTESPLLALNMIAKAVEAQHEVRLEFDHVFSCEIEPFKQAYIERNFAPPILFRDVTELGRKKAHTAYGSLVDVPGNVDILIAGTSCVDYSGLNNEKQDIDANGESGRTFRGMLQWVKKHQPPVVILENVCNAPWDKVVEYFGEINYDAHYTRLDTKEYYIPHTRTRVYLFATPFGKGKPEHLPEKWIATVRDLKRPWSVPFEAFLLPADDVNIHRARLDLAAARLYRDGSGRKPTDWGRCESRHARARQEEGLGILRPLTSWQEAGVCKGLDWTWNDWLLAQTERVVDLLEISTLRMAKDGIDAGYKACIWNVSQNVDRQTGSSRTALAPCLTPNMIPWVTNRGGPVTGREALALQGIPVRELLLTSENEDQLADLAGNAMTTTVVGASMLAALCLTVDKLAEGEDAMAESMAARAREEAEKAKVGSRIVGEKRLKSYPLDLTKVKSVDLKKLLDVAQRSSRHCECEGQSGISTSPINHCTACGGRSCTACGGRPEHEYEPCTDQRIETTEFEKFVKELLPMRVNLSGLSPASLSAAREKAESDGKGSVKSSDFDMWSEAILGAVNDTEFRFRFLKRQAIWTAVYEAPTATLELCLRNPAPEWRLTVKAPSTEPVKSRLRELLLHPVARMGLDMSKRDVLSGKWELCMPTYQKFTVKLTGCGEIVPTWQASLGLQDGMDGTTRWSQVCVELPEEAKTALDRDLSGVYTLLPKCGGAQASLHVKESDDSDLPPLFFFLDPTRCGDAVNDKYVFSTSIERLDYYTERDIIATLDKKWRESKDVKQTVQLEINGGWTLCKPAALKSISSEDIVAGSEATYAIPASVDSVSTATHDCSQSAALLSVKVPLDPSHSESMWNRDGWGEIDLEHAGNGTFAQLAWITERIPPLDAFASWNLIADAETEACAHCAPLPPTIHWIRVPGKVNKNGNKTKSVVSAYEDRLEAGRYEQALKNRPSPFVVQLRLDNDIGSFRIGLNVRSLAHRALSRLPPSEHMGNIKLSWRLTPNQVTEVPRPPRVFVLPSNKRDPEHTQPKDFKLPLRKEQLRSVWWMLRQERAEDKTHTFVEEEISETALPALGWRAEGKAERPVMVRGGVIADQVGYGKTIISLALIAETRKAPAPEPEPTGLIDLKATLIVVPGHLSMQWPSEIARFTGKTFNTIVIQSNADLNGFSIAEMEKADIIVMASDIFDKDPYWKRMEYLSAHPQDWLSDKNGGRFFNERLDAAMKSLLAHTQCLKEHGAAAASAMMAEHQDKMASDAASKVNELKAVSFGKRLKGAAYRDKYDAEPRPKKAKTEKKKSQDEKESSEEKSMWEVDEDEEYEEEEVEDDLMAAPVFHDASGKDSVDSSTVKKNFRFMTCPSIHMFRFRRVIADEFTYLDKRVLAAVLRLSSSYKWILSGTPPVNDFPAIRSIATFMGIHLGVEDDAEGSAQVAKARAKEKTKAEKFHAFREVHSPAWHRRREDLAQEFLNVFVRQNIAEIDDIPTVEHIHTIKLPASEGAVYLELEHHLQALEMQARKETKFKNVSQGDRNARLEEALADSRTAEEALLKRCCHFTLDLTDKKRDAKSALEACQHIASARKKQLEGCEEDLRNCINQAVAMQAWIRKHGGFARDERQPFAEWVDFSFDLSKHHGDAEAAGRLVSVLNKCNFRAGAIPDVPADGKPAKIEAKADADDVKWSLREHTHLLRRLSKELVARVRSLRFFDVVRKLQHSDEERAAVLERSECGHRPSDGADLEMAILSCCGHVSCHACMVEAVDSQRCVKGDECHAAVRHTNIVKVSSLGIEGELSSGRFGAKLERLVSLIKQIPARERILVFVQWEDLYPKVAEAFDSAGVNHVTLAGSVKARANTLDRFQSSTSSSARVLLLKMNDASAAGSNLTTANHAIFLGPLFTSSLLDYKAVETQAIGRVRRFGQTKTVHIHRLLALDTIDMTIYDTRTAELRTKPDHVEIPKEEYVVGRKALPRRPSNDSVELVLVVDDD